MVDRFSITFWLIWPIFLLFFLPGCGQNGSDLGKEVLIRVDDKVVTALDFNEAFEIAKTAYAHNIKEQPEELRKAQLRVLNQLIVEVVLLERAEELGISVTDVELNKAVTRIKSDYPEGEFEEALLEFAVSYDSWESRLKTRLTMEKVIDEELKNRISITPEDIAEYYKKNYQGQRPESDSPQTSEDINELIVKQLRTEKAEKDYKFWIEDLKQKYTIEINSEQWEKITGFKSIKPSGTDDS